MARAKIPPHESFDSGTQKLLADLYAQWPTKALWAVVKEARKRKFHDYGPEPEPKKLLVARAQALGASDIISAASLGKYDNPSAHEALSRFDALMAKRKEPHQ